MTAWAAVGCLGTLLISPTTPLLHSSRTRCRRKRTLLWGDVSVSRTGPDLQRGYSWAVTFNSIAGNFPDSVSEVAGLAVNSNYVVRQLSRGSAAPCKRCSTLSWTA